MFEWCLQIVMRLLGLGASLASLYVYLEFLFHFWPIEELPASGDTDLHSRVTIYNIVMEQFHDFYFTNAAGLRLT